MLSRQRKRCPGCGKRKALSRFHSRKDGKDGKRNLCINCRSIIRLKPKYRYNDYKYGAKRRGLIFKLDMMQFQKITSQSCYYCGGFSGQGYEKKYNGVDRINSKDGYTKNNCVSACAICNYMKRHTDAKSFLRQIKKISEHHHLMAVSK